jgi:hypothetical protein
MASTTCPRNLPQHFNGCTCVAVPGAVTAEVTDVDLMAPPAPNEPAQAAQPKRHVWSTDPDKVKPPKAAVALVTDAEDAGMKVEVRHGETTVEVAIENGRNNVAVTWLKGDYYDEPDRGKLPFRTGGTPTKGVRFYMANGYIHGEYPVIRSARQARLYMGLPEK